MLTQYYSILIHADKQKVWKTMLGKDTYTAWTTPFHEGSFFEGSWEQGSEIRFLAKEADGSVSGMFSRIKERKPYEFVSIEHLGIIHQGVVDTTSDEVKRWAPSLENYSFKEDGSHTQVNVDVQLDPEYITMFEEMWPKALLLLKELCEA